MNQETKPKQQFNLWKVLIIMLLGAISLLIWTMAKPSTPDEIFDDYFEPYIIQTTPRGLTEDSDNYMMGTIHYRDGEYDLAISELKNHLKENATDYRAQLMLGITYLAIKNFNAAEVVLLALANDPNHLFQDQSRWYLGLLYLTDGNEENDNRADEYFEKIEDEALLTRTKDL